MIASILTWEDPVSCLADRNAISGPLSGNVAWNISPVLTLKPKTKRQKTREKLDQILLCEMWLPIPYMIGQAKPPRTVVFISPIQAKTKSISNGSLWNASDKKQK